MRNYGNLATTLERKPKQRQVKRTFIRRRGLPSKEKLLYLGTVLLFAVIATFIIMQHVKLSEINQQVHAVERQVTKMDEKNSSLQLKITELKDPERIKREAEKMGLKEDPNRVRQQTLGE